MLSRIPQFVRIFSIPIILGAAFIGRSYFVDDHYQMLMARHVIEEPMRPYDFVADDAGPRNRGWERGQPPRMVNPPLHHYLLGLIWEAADEDLRLVRLGMLVLSGISALLIFRLAQWMLIPPGPATALSVLTPAFWLSSYSLLIDPTMLMFFLGALCAWIEGLKKNSALLLTLSGALAGCTILTKYTGGFVIVLCVAWWWLQKPEERRWRSLCALAIPAAMLALWSYWNIQAYGAPHLTESSKRAVQGLTLSRGLVFLVFFSGAMGVPLIAWRFGRALPSLLATGVLAAFLASPWGGYSPFQAFLIAAFAVGSLFFLITIVRQSTQGLSRPADRFLIFWLLLGSAQMILVMGWVAARYYLTLVVPVAFLTCRWLQVIYRHSPSRRNLTQTVLCLALVFVSLGAGVADYLQARATRRIVSDTNRDGWLKSGRRCFVLGDSFTSSYLQDAGWRSAFPETVFEKGDLVLTPTVVMPRWWFRPDPARFGLMKTYEYPSKWPVRVMDNRGAAGFYASAWGALPYTLSRGPLERYLLLEVR